jgi:hypothetical protein
VRKAILNVERVFVAAVILSGFASAVIWLHYQSLESAVAGIRTRVTVVVTDVSLHDEGRGGVSATVYSSLLAARSGVL